MFHASLHTPTGIAIYIYLAIFSLTAAAAATPACGTQDIFAINQHAGAADLCDGQTLADTIDVTVASLVVLDQGGTPFTRLWCARAVPTRDPSAQSPIQECAMLMVCTHWSSSCAL